MVRPETRLQRVWSSMRLQLQGTKNLAFPNRPGLRPVGQPTTWSHLCRSLHCTLLGEGEHQPRQGPQAASTRPYLVSLWQAALRAGRCVALAWSSWGFWHQWPCSGNNRSVRQQEECWQWYNICSTSETRSLEPDH